MLIPITPSSFFLNPRFKQDILHNHCFQNSMAVLLENMKERLSSAIRDRLEFRREKPGSVVI